MSNFGQQGVRKFRRAASAVAVCGLLGAAYAVPADAAITGTNNADTLAGAITGTAVTGAGFSGAQPPTYYPAGVGDAALAGFPTSGNTFTILTSGDARIADDPNDDTGSGENNDFNLLERGDANDPVTLAIPVEVPAGTNCLSFDYKFLSEEFPEYVTAGYNDRFFAELDGTSWTSAADAFTAPLDFATSKGDAVSVDTVGPTTVTDLAAAGTTYDGATEVLTTKATVAPGPHTLYLSITDSGDYVLDSAAFLDNIRFTNETPQACKPPDIFAGTVGVITPTKFKVVGKNALVPVFCGLAIGITVNCEGSISMSAKLPKAGNKAGRAKAKVIGKGTYAVAPQTSADIPVKLSKKAKKYFKSSKKLKATVTIVNFQNGATTSYKVKLKK